MQQSQKNNAINNQLDHQRDTAIRVMSRLRKLCSGDIWGQALLSLLWNSWQVTIIFIVTTTTTTITTTTATTTTTINVIIVIMSKGRQFKILMERSPGIPLMLSVLADVGGVMAGILQVVAHYHHGGRGHLNQQDHRHHNWHDQMFHQVTWGNNKDRLRMLAEKFRILSPRSKHISSYPHGFTVRN